ncbi:response regulator [Paenibacillus chondroitinus]|uniref:Response regulator n=1 Tax=Paenibacillus chondroitinus TaxID=59842 RepID=A0ABU6DCF6_9BACL|nr:MULTISPECIES: response regulator [Paenibacillus]MCY9657683.1 response regulator [Paenibacillus anseongense]MEB4794977.1 response regulator [Paenibacillus chondroitinus]
MIPPSKTILIVDDEPLTREGIRKTLEAWSIGRYHILSSSNGTEALEVLNTRPVHLLITDIRMPEISGLQVVEDSRNTGHKPVVIVISGHPDFQYAQTAIQLGVVNYLLKPIKKSKLLEAVEQALQIEEERGRVETMEKMVDSRLMQAKTVSMNYSPPVRQAVLYVEEHLQEPLGMSEVAGHIHLNPSYFSALFKEQTGFTFSEYVTRSRIQKAKELLLQTRLTIADISEQIGYQTSKYFIKLFKDYEGISPNQYRKQANESEENMENQN